MDSLLIKVTLVDIDPPVWRRLDVPADTNLEELHELIQIAMGWHDEHLFSFYLKPAGSKSRQFRNWTELDSEASIPLANLLTRRSDEIVYEYDFGDSWIHRIKLEKRIPSAEVSPVPKCTDGRRACPPEDCGGVYRYADLLDALTDESHPEHDDALDWMGDDFDPEKCDLEEINDLIMASRTTWKSA